jgi:hypothetical protein
MSRTNSSAIVSIVRNDEAFDLVVGCVDVREIPAAGVDDKKV